MSLGKAWLAPGPIKQMMNKGALGTFHKYTQPPEELAQYGLLELNKELISDDPILLSIRFAVFGIEKTLSDPVQKNAFIRSERKSRYLQSDALLKIYPSMLETYEAWFSNPTNFSDWWDEGSIYQRVSDILC